MPDRLVAHCLLVEGADGLTLVDTGIGAGDVADPGRLGAPFVAVTGAALDLEETAVMQVRALGHDPADVRDVVLTHLDLDHAGGLGDFPGARHLGQQLVPHDERVAGRHSQRGGHRHAGRRQRRRCQQRRIAGRQRPRGVHQLFCRHERYHPGDFRYFDGPERLRDGSYRSEQ